MSGNAIVTGPGGSSIRVDDIGGGIYVDAAKVHIGALGADSGPSNVTALGGGVFAVAYASGAIPSTGVQVYAGACVGMSLNIANTTGGTVFPFLYDSTSTGANASTPYIWLGALANNVLVNFQLGAPGFGASFSTGIWLQMSGLAYQFSDTGSTLFSANFVYWHA